MAREEAERELQRSAASEEDHQEEELMEEEEEVSTAGNGDEEELAAGGEGEEGKSKLPKGRWLPTTISAQDLQQLEEDGVLLPQAASGWRIPSTNDVLPSPAEGERVVFRAHFERGFSMPPSKFLLKVLARYNAQMYNFPLNSIQVLSGYIALCEGYLGIEPSIELFEYFYAIKR